MFGDIFYPNRYKGAAGTWPERTQMPRTGRTLIAKTGPAQQLLG